MSSLCIIEDNCLNSNYCSDNSDYSSDNSDLDKNNLLFPPEILKNIFKYIRFIDLIYIVSNVCKSWRNACKLFKINLTIYDYNRCFNQMNIIQIYDNSYMDTIYLKSSEYNCHSLLLLYKITSIFNNVNYLNSYFFMNFHNEIILNDEQIEKLMNNINSIKYLSFDFKKFNISTFRTILNWFLKYNINLVTLCINNFDRSKCDDFNIIDEIKELDVENIMFHSCIINGEVPLRIESLRKLCFENCLINSCILKSLIPLKLDVLEFIGCSCEYDNTFTKYNELFPVLRKFKLIDYDPWGPKSPYNTENTDFLQFMLSNIINIECIQININNIKYLDYNVITKLSELTVQCICSDFYNKDTVSLINDLINKLSIQRYKGLFKLDVEINETEQLELKDFYKTLNIISDIMDIFNTVKFSCNFNIVIYRLDREYHKYVINSKDSKDSFSDILNIIFEDSEEILHNYTNYADYDDDYEDNHADYAGY